MIHEVKTWPEYFDAVRSGAKTFEVRKNDRPYAVSDLLVQRKWDPRTESYVDEPSLWHRITYVLQGGQFGIEDGYVVLGLGEVEHG